MLRKFSILLTLFLSSYNAMASNSNLPEAGEAKAPAMQVAKPIDDYLKETKKPMLLLGCGHNGELDPKETVPATLPFGMIFVDPKTGETKNATIARVKYTMNNDGTLTHHAHEGWYTVDMDSTLKPDLLADLTQQSTLDYVFQPNRFQVVYQENMEDSLLTESLFTRIANCLLPGGAFICTFPGAARPGVLQTHAARSLPQVWKKALDVAPGDFKKDKGYKVQTEYGNDADLNKQLAPYFRHLGFSNVTVHKSLGAIFMALKRTKALPNQPVQLFDGRVVLAETLLRDGPNPEAGVVDDFFKKVGLGELYIIARK